MKAQTVSISVWKFYLWGACALPTLGAALALDGLTTLVVWALGGLLGIILIVVAAAVQGE